MERIIAIGDIHASAESLIEIARRIPLTDRRLNWTAEKTLLILTGDICDRGRESRTLYSLLMQWQKDAPGKGSEVVFIIGNHEVMAVWGMSHYTTEEEYAGYGGGDLRMGREGRQRAFSPGGWIHSWLARQRFIASRDGIIFAHGDLPAAFQEWNVEEIEDYTRAAFRSARGDGYFRYDLPDPLFSESGSIIWCREAEYGDAAGYGTGLKKFLETNKAFLYVCGHTPSRSGRMKVRFSGRYLCVDTAMTFRSYGFGMDSALIIEKGTPEAWYFKPGRILKERLDTAVPG